MSSAEDLSQETFVRAWQGLKGLEDESSFGSWLLTIAAHVCQEWRRRQEVRERHAVEAARAERIEPPPGEPDLLLAEAVAALPGEMQQILALRHAGGMSCEEIARELNKPLGTVTKTLSRAYAELREKLVKR